MPTVRGSMIQHSQAEVSACTQGEHRPLPLMTKGENDSKELEVAIKSKGGDCWHFGTGVALRYRCYPWWQLSLITDLSLDYKFHIRRLIKLKLRIHAGTLYTKSRIRRFSMYEVVYTRRFMNRKGRTCREASLWSVVVSPRYLSLCCWTKVPRQSCWSRVLKLMVLYYYGFGSWYWGGPNAI